jgi:hypothetical protein
VLREGDTLRVERVDVQFEDKLYFVDEGGLDYFCVEVFDV